MLLLYTHQETPRVRYAFNLVFRYVLGIRFEITTDAAHFSGSSGPKMSYSTKKIGDEPFIESEGLLFEKGIKPVTELPKDPFALAFFLASRYEEYLPFEADEYGRFPSTLSLLHKHGLLHKPLVNIRAEEIRNTIVSRYPAFAFPEKKYTFTPTIDIDNAYAYSGKNLARTLGGYARAVSKSDPEDFRKRKNVLSGKEKDPFDTYEFQIGVHKKYSLKPLYFFLLGDWAENDKNLPHTSTVMQTLINSISSHAETGIHPSYSSNQHPEKIKIEKERLEKILASPVTKSRQHFLKLIFPQTYRNLITAGITDDYTMGYADAVGFRAGICTAFKWYDLENEKETNLTIHPFAVMDGTLNTYLKLSPSQAVEKVKALAKEVKNVNGEFITIWHNETLSGWREWKGWEDVYEQTLQAAV